MTISKNIASLRFNKLIAIKYSTRKGSRNSEYWLFKCDCGKEKIVRKTNVVFGETKSCGCSKKEPLSGTKFYKTYFLMKQRCENNKNPRYKNYGGRGIKIFWKSFEEFENDMYNSFIKHEEKYGGRQTSIERIDNNGNYCKENCRWATAKEQANNRRPRIRLNLM